MEAIRKATMEVEITNLEPEPVGNTPILLHGLAQRAPKRIDDT